MLPNTAVLPPWKSMSDVYLYLSLGIIVVL